MIMEEFDAVTINVKKQQEQRQKLFLVLTLVGLPPDHDSVCDEILAGHAVPTIEYIFSHLLSLATPSNQKVASSSTTDSSILAFQTINKRTY